MRIWVPNATTEAEKKKKKRWNLLFIQNKLDPSLFIQKKKVWDLYTEIIYMTFHKIY